MLPILQRRLRALENSKESMLDHLRAIPADRQNERPSPGRWSAAELIRHVASFERGILETVTQKMADADESSVKLRDRVGSLIVRNVMRSPLRVKLPSEHVPTTPDSLADAASAIAEWQAVRDEWHTFLSHVRGPQLKTAVFSHPRGGWFTLPETVLFLRLHHEQHRAQMGKIVKALASREPVLVA